MEYITDLRDYNSDRPCVVTLGKFDGVHRGHRKLIRRVHALARQHGVSLETVRKSIKH